MEALDNRSYFETLYSRKGRDLLIIRRVVVVVESAQSI